MRSIENFKLSENFTLYEFIEGINMPEEAIELNWENIDELNIDEAIQIAERVQKERDYVNEVFQEENGGVEIGFAITSGFRCLEWEHSQGRSGNGMHPKSKAMDIIPINVNKKLGDKIIKHLYTRNKSRQNGWYGGFAIKEPTPKSVGFVHYDNRREVARWMY